MFKKVLYTITLTFSALSFTGCIFLAAGAAGVGTAKWLSDKVTQQVSAPREKVIKSARSALTDMKANVYKETAAPEVAQILAKDSLGRQIWVDVRPLADNLTRIDVRVGYADGQQDAAKILQRIVDKSKSWI
jgi:hypothetical protein